MKFVQKTYASTPRSAGQRYTVILIKVFFCILQIKIFRSRQTEKEDISAYALQKIPRGESIEQRAKEIDSRCTFGHWEMDTVIGKQTKGRVLLVLTERLTRWEIIIPMKDKTAGSVKRIIDRLERKHGAAFRSIFKSITVDNGPEFSDCAGIEKSKYTKGKRTKVYYCHPYSSWERGSNENQNRMIRRMIPKGADLNKIPVKVIKEVERWLNNYPRGIFEYKTSEELFQKYIKGIA